MTWNPRTIGGRRRIAGVALGSVPPETPEGPTEPEPETSSVPTAANTKAEIQAYLDSQGIAWTTDLTKEGLLALIP